MDNCLLMPIKSKDSRILGILEISNNTSKNDLGCDDEYLCMVLVRLLGEQLSQIYRNREL